jgi:hypothetical protein
MVTTTRDDPDRTEPITDKERPPWFRTSFEGRFSPQMRQLLEEYSGIPAGDVDQHVYDIVRFPFTFPLSTCQNSDFFFSFPGQREKAWAASPYPCIGGFAFLLLGFSKHPKYSSILERLKPPANRHKNDGSSLPPNLIDLGCGLGQDVRKLASDGVSTSQLWGSDIHSGLLQLGFDLFRDRQRWSSTALFPMDVFHPALPQEAPGRFDIVHIAMFLHLFSRPKQIEVCEQIVTRILSEKAGSMLVGSQAGSVHPRAVPSRRHKDRESFLHNVESFTTLWDEIGQRNNCQFDVDTISTTPWEADCSGSKSEDRYFMGDDTRWLVFTVTRV